MAFHYATGLRTYFEGLPVNVLGSTQREVQQSGTNSGVGQAVDDHEAAHVTVGVVGIERDRSICCDGAHADLVEFE